MSYDLSIIKADDPYGEPQGVLDVKTIIRAINSFPPFAKRGITWSNQPWGALKGFEGLMIDLQGHDPERIAPGQFDDEAGTCDSVGICVSAATDDSALVSCMELAVSIGEATGARVWDLQTDQDLVSLVSGKAKHHRS